MHVQLAHRLDRETSGVLVATKDPTTNDRVHRAFREQRVRKGYLALVVGQPSEERFVVEGPIGRHPNSRVQIRMAVVSEGTPARTEAEVIERLPGCSMLRVRPTTGKTHQIRVHLSHASLPVVGDKIYGPDEGLFLRWLEDGLDETDWAILGMRRQALHAETLELPHPWRTGLVYVESPTPADIRIHRASLRNRVDTPKVPS